MASNALTINLESTNMVIVGIKKKTLEKRVQHQAGHVQIQAHREH